MGEMKRLALASLLAGIALVGAPALADVKAGVDAWQRGDYKTAIGEWRALAVAGDPDAQFNLAQAYKLGRGVPADMSQAEEWYRKAALQGHPQAQENYGLVLFENNKRQQAVEWLQKAAARGEPRSQYVLGTMYFNGDAVERDWVRAYALTLRAAAEGLPQASTAQAQMDRHIGLSDRQKGLELARVYERDARRPHVADTPGSSVSDSSIARVDLPAPTAPEQVISQGATPKAVEPRLSPPIVRPAPRQTPRPAPSPASAAVVPARDGGWRVQVGAFGDPANARRAGAQAGSRFSGRQISYVKAGPLTRVLVGPFASSAEAQRACGSFSPCVPVRK